MTTDRPTPGTQRPEAARSPTPRRAPRSSPTPAPSARRYNYYKPAKRKQTHYEDVTVDVQPDPRHYLSQGWIYGFANGERGLPADLDQAEGLGRRQARARARPRLRRHAKDVEDWPAHGWHEFRDPNEEWEMTFYRYNANVVRQVNQNIENARQAKAFDQWTPNWVPLRRAQRRRLDAHRAHPRPLRVRRLQPLRPDEHAQHRDGR